MRQRSSVARYLSAQTRPGHRSQ